MMRNFKDTKYLHKMYVLNFKYNVDFSQYMIVEYFLQHSWTTQARRSGQALEVAL